MPINASCSGAVSQSTLNANNSSFAAGQLLIIHQTRGVDAGKWEFNKIEGR